MRTRSLKANFLINVAGAIVPLVVALLTVPLYIRHIGADRYGVLAIVWVLLGYLGFLDFGLSRAAVRTLARLKDASQVERARVLVTTLALNLAFGLLGSVGLASLGGYLLQHVLSVPPSLIPEIRSAFPWVVALFPVALLGGVGVGTLESRERFLLANLLGIGGMAVGQVFAVVLAVTVSPSLAVVIPAAVVIRVVMVGLVFLVVWRQERPLALGHFDRGKARELFSFGGWLTVSGVISPVLTSLDQFVIGALLSVTSVAHYAVPMNLIVRSQVFPAALIRTLFPRLSGLPPAEARILAVRALTAIAFGYATLCVPAALMAPTFFRFWVGPDFAVQAAPVAAILFVGAWINALAFVPYELLQSQGRADITGKLHAAEVLPFIAVLWCLTATFGILGAAVAWVLRCAVDGACLFYAARMSKVALKQAALPFLLLIPATLSATIVGAEPSRTIPVGLSAGLFMLGLSLTCARDLRRLANGFLERLPGKPRSSPATTAQSVDDRRQGMLSRQRAL